MTARGRRGWTLIETLGVASLSAAFFLFAGGVALSLRAHYAALAQYAGDLERGSRQLDALARDVRRARRSLAATPDGALRAGPALLILEQPDQALTVYRLRAATTPGRAPRLERLRGAASALVAEDLGPAGSLQVDLSRAGEVGLTLGLVDRAPGQPPALLSTAARLRAEGAP